VSLLCRTRLVAALIAVLASATAAEAAPVTPSAVLPPGQDPAALSFAYFQERLSPFGHWLRHPVWGDVWQPDAGPTFRPYFYGYWQYTSDYGWLWVSNEPYGEIVYHYGRWVFDPNYGWLWVPGYVWGPSWVAWRESDGYVGWLPMPPGYQDFSANTVAPSYAPSDLYGYQNFYGQNFGLDAFTGLWVFVPAEDFARTNRRPYVIDRDRPRELYRRSPDRTHYVHDRDHDRVVDRSIDKDALERSTHRSFGAQDSGQFLPRGVTVPSVSQGQELWRRNRDRDRSLPSADGTPNLRTPGVANTSDEGRINVRPSSDNPGEPRFGRGVGGSIGRYASPQTGGQGLQAPENIPAGGAGDNPNRRELGRFTRGRNPPASVGVIGGPSPPNSPSTEGVRGAQAPLVPGAIPHGAPQANPLSGGLVPERAPGRTRIPGFGLVGGPPPAAAPNLARGTAPPLLPQTPGVQPLGLQQAPVAAPPVVLAPPIAPAPVPQTQGAQGARVTRGLMEGK
jgi:hypothetical protein